MRRHAATLLRRRAATMSLGLALTSALGIATSVPTSAQSTDITITRDVPYRTVDGVSLTLDAYLPAGPGPHPALIVIPGGRWVDGNKDESTWLPVDLAEQGYAAFPVNYRPATQAPFPAAFEDLQAAVRFIREGAARFDIDPARLGAVGASAGGHLAALLATWGEGSTSSGTRVLAAVSWSGPMDLERLLQNDRADVRSDVRTFLGCSASEPCVDQAREGSPIRHVDPTDGALYLGNGTEEVIPLTQATLMIAELQRNGVPHQLVVTTGREHGFGAVHNDKFFGPALAFLGTRLGGEEQSAPSPAASPGGKPAPSGPSVAAPPADEKGAGHEPVSRVEVIPWWAIAAVVAAVIAALASIVVSVVFIKRMRITSRPDAHGARDKERTDSHEPSTPLVNPGTDALN